jgi:conjugative relaxase-like TrwC/TraI family protein
MLSVGSVSSASGATSYYAADNYYTKDTEEAAGEWFGKGAEALELKGDVDPKVFEEVLAGDLPNGEKLTGGAKEHRPGFDLTFSAPKSVSLMALVGKDERLVKAHGDAVKATLGWAEKNLAEARQGKDGKETVQTGKLVVALFQHDTSRALDPQLHTHAVIANVTQRTDGEWRALKNDQLYAENMLLGAIYHNELKTRAAALGYEIIENGKNGTFEIAGISRDTIEAWSQRSAQINEIAERLGVTSPEAKGEIALRSRDTKQDVAPPDLKQSWQQLAHERGDNFTSVVATPPEHKADRGVLDRMRGWGENMLDKVTSFWRPRPEPMVADNQKLRSSEAVGAAYGVAAAVRHLDERSATFKGNDVLREALNFAGTKSNIGAIQTRLGNLIGDGVLLEGRGDNSGRLATPDMIANEKAIVAFAKNGHGQIESRIDAQASAKSIQTAANTNLGFELRDEQLKAAQVILYGPDRVTIVQGDSGTGKSTIFAAINAVPKDQRPELAMLTNQSGLARDLEADSGIRTNTVAHFLTRHEPLATTRQQPRAEDKSQWQGKTLIVDEASMLSSRQMLGLFKISEKLGIERIALVGDQKQIPAIEAGRPFALLQEKLGATHLTQNIRQRDPEMRSIVEKLGAGDIRGAFDLLESRTVETSDPATAAAQAYLALDNKGQGDTAIFTSGRRLREAVLGTLAKGQGQDVPSTTLSVFENRNLTREEFRHVSSYQAGMQLDLYRQQHALGLEKGSYKVTGTYVQRGTVAVEQNGRRHMIEPAKLHPNAGGMALSTPKTIEVREGQRLMVTLNLPNRRVANGDRFMLSAIEGDRLRLEAQNGRQLLLEADDPLRSRLDHGDALNMHRVQGQTVDNAITVLSAEDRTLNSQSLVYVLASRARDGFTLYVDDKERVIAQIERNDGKSLHALDLEAGADKAAREADARVEKQYGEESDPTIEGNVKSERLVSNTLRSNSEPHKIAENVPVRELTRDFDIS